MTKREVIKLVLDGKKPLYVPWSYKFTLEPEDLLELGKEGDTSIENMLALMRWPKINYNLS